MQWWARFLHTLRPLEPSCNSFFCIFPSFVSGHGQFSAGQHRCAKVLAIKRLPESHLCDFAAIESVSDTSSFLLQSLAVSCSVLNCWISRNVNICKVTAELVQLIIFVKNRFRSRQVPTSWAIFHTSQSLLSNKTQDIYCQDLSITFIGFVYFSVSEFFVIALERSNVSVLSSGNICHYEKQKKTVTNTCTQTERIIAFAFWKDLSVLVVLSLHQCDTKAFFWNDPFWKTKTSFIYHELQC